MRCIKHNACKLTALGLGAALAISTPAEANVLGAQPADATQGNPPSPQVFTIPKSPEFPGSRLTLTQPINTLQPIPPTASELQSPLN